jgi:hypothetical protein
MDRRPIDSRIQFSSPQAVVKGGCILPGSISRIKFAGGQIKFCSIWIPTPCVKENRCPRDFGRGCFDVASVTCRARQYPYCCCCRRCRRRHCCCCCCCCNCRCRAWLLQLTKKTSAADVARRPANTALSYFKKWAERGIHFIETVLYLLSWKSLGNVRALFSLVIITQVPCPSRTIRYYEFRPSHGKYKLHHSRINETGG